MSNLSAKHTPSPTKQKPPLPPRLPPRQGPPTVPSSKSVVPKDPPPSYLKSIETAAGSSSRQQRTTSFVNQGAVDRLSRAGVSVPGLGIGNQSGGVGEERILTAQSPSSATAISTNVSELQARFTKLNSSTTSDEVPPTPTSSSKKPPFPPKRSGLQPSTKITGHDDPTKVTTTNPEIPPPVPLGTRPK